MKMLTFSKIKYSLKLIYILIIIALTYKLLRKRYNASFCKNISKTGIGYISVQYSTIINGLVVDKSSICQTYFYEMRKTNDCFMDWVNVN